MRSGPRPAPRGEQPHGAGLWAAGDRVQDEAASKPNLAEDVPGPQRQAALSTLARRPCTCTSPQACGQG